MITVNRTDRPPSSLTPPLYRLDRPDTEILKTELQTTTTYVPKGQGVAPKTVITSATAYAALDAGEETALLSEINDTMVEEGGTPWASLADFYTDLPAGMSLYAEQAFFP